MSAALRGGRGGSFCQFTVGSGGKGASVRHLRYIANPQAVRDRHAGVWLQGVPALLVAMPYPVLVSHLCAWAQELEQEEVLRHRGRGTARTHYQAILSFETPLSHVQATTLLAGWMHESFPRAQAAAFVHTNARHLHIHVWIAARQTDGRKINLPARAFRQLDETWNRLYSRALNRDEREHLLKKGQTERWKQLRREGMAQEWERPARVGHSWKAEMFNARERERLGVRGEEHDRHETGAGSDQSRLAGNASGSADREPGVTTGKQGAETSSREVQQAFQEVVRAVSAAQQLYRDAQSVAERDPEQDRALEPPRER